MRQPSTENRERAHEQGALERSSRPRQGAYPSIRRDPLDVFSYGPFALMRRLQDDIDHLFGGTGTGRGWPAWSGESERSAWAPAIEAFHRGNEFVVRADVPGLSREDLSVEIGEDALTLSGERKYNRDEEREGVFTNERSYGSFYRVIPLPEGAVADSAKANFKDGVLEIIVQTPPQEVRRGRRVEINQENPTKAGK